MRQYAASTARKRRAPRRSSFLGRGRSISSIYRRSFFLPDHALPVRVVLEHLRVPAPADQRPQHPLRVLVGQLDREARQEHVLVELALRRRAQALLDVAEDVQAADLLGEDALAIGHAGGEELPAE